MQPIEATRNRFCIDIRVASSETSYSSYMDFRTRVLSILSKPSAADWVAIFISIAALATTSLIAIWQLNLAKNQSDTAREQTDLSAKMASYQKQREALSGFQVGLTNDFLYIVNPTTSPLIDAGYWILGRDHNERMEQRFSTLTPVPACTQFVIKIDDIGIPRAARPNAAILIYRDTPDTWMSISDDGVMQRSAAPATQDPISAIRELDSYALMFDTVLEGVSVNNEQVIEDGTAPIDRNTALYAVRGSVKARMEGIPCTR